MAQNLYKGQFGMETLFPIKQDHIDSISRHYQAFGKTSSYTLDTTTWTDLDMDDIYKKVNMSYCGAGDIMLYCMLHQPCITNAALQQRYDIMKWAKQEEKERESVISILSKGGKRYEDDLEQPFQECHAQTVHLPVSYGLLIAFAISTLCAISIGGVYILVAVLLAITNFIRYWVLHKKLEPYLDSLVYIVNHMEVLHKLAKLDFNGLPEIKRQANDLSKKVALLRKSSSLSFFDEAAGSLNPITQKESRLFTTYSRFIFENADVVKEAFAFVGQLDACISMASFSVYSKANVNITLKEGECVILAEAMVHPLVTACVENTVDIKEHRLLTGSNATGKSTYLKMVAINAILAQSFHFVYAKSYTAGFFQISTSMSIHDDLEQKASTFVAEVKSLKYLLDLDDTLCPTLCIIDEILRGTNTLERIASSSAILREFTKKRGICLGATHDIELTQILKQEYSNYHFSEQMKDGQMMFDYKIQTGITTTRNAIALLSLLGYEEALINHAKNRLDLFEKTGVWEIFA